LGSDVVSDDKEREAVAFEKWFESQRKFSSLAAMERSLNITEDYLHLIRDGKRRAIDPILRQKLYEATGLEIFKPITTTMERQAPPNLPSIATKSATVMPDAQRERKQARLPENLPDLLSIALKKMKLTIPQCSEKYGISLHNLKKYKSGARKPTSEGNAAAILKILQDSGLTNPAEQVTIEARAEVTRQSADIKALVREVNALRREIDDVDKKLSAIKLYDIPQVKQEAKNPETRAKRVMQLLLGISAELEFFKQCPESGRVVFRRTVPGPDVGYVTTLLRALYDEDKFQRWLLFSNYEMKGKNNGD